MAASRNGSVLGTSMADPEGDERCVFLVVESGGSWPLSSACVARDLSRLLRDRRDRRRISAPHSTRCSPVWGCNRNHRHSRFPRPASSSQWPSSTLPSNSVALAPVSTAHHLGFDRSRRMGRGRPGSGLATGRGQDHACAERRGLTHRSEDRLAASRHGATQRVRLRGGRLSSMVAGTALKIMSPGAAPVTR